MVQATFAEALEDPEAGKINLRAWLAGTSRNLVRNQWRSNSRRRAWEEKAAIPAEVVRNQSAELAEYMTETTKAIGQLPEPERQAIMFRYIQEMKPREIASELQIPVNQVYRLLESSRDKLRSRMERRYGKGWQAMGMSLLAMPKSPTALPASISTSLMRPLAWVAGVAILATIGASYLDWGKDQTANSAAALVSSPLAGESASDGLQDSPVESRGLGTQAATIGGGISIQAISPEGTPVAMADLSAHYLQSRDTFEAASDEEGFVVFDIPTDAQGIRIGGWADSLWTTGTHLASYPSEVCEILFSPGVHEVHFDAGLAPAESTVFIQGGEAQFGSPQWTGRVLTNAEGEATAYLPVYGNYSARIEGGFHSGNAKRFSLTPLGTHGPIPLDYGTPMPLEVAVFSKSGESLTEAEFHLQRRNDLADASDPHPFTYEAIAATRGRLVLDPIPEDWQNCSIQVRHAGFRSGMVPLRKGQVPFVKVVLDPEEMIAATMVNTKAPETTWASLFMMEVVPSFYGSVGEEPDLHGQVARSLAISEDGSFDLPRPTSGSAGPLTLIGMDTEGNAHRSEAYPKESRDALPAVFEVHSKESRIVTFAFPASFAFSSSHVAYGSTSVHPKTWSPVPMERNSAGHHLLESAMDEYVMVVYEGDGYAYEVFPSLPEGQPQCHIDIPPFATDARLEGVIRRSDDSPLPEQYELTATYLGPWSPQESYTQRRKPELRVKLVQEGGVFRSPACPPGNYRIDLTLGDYIRSMEVSTSQAFDEKVPATHMLLARVRDRDTMVDIAVTVYNARSKNEYGHLSSYKNMQPGELNLIAYIPFEIDFSDLVITARGWQPTTAAAITPGILADVFTSKARAETLRIDLETVGGPHISGNSWRCSAWGDFDDPRQALIRATENHISCQYFPPEAFELIEYNAEGEPTGRTITVEAED